jgi:dienelactone hydrolase
MFPNTFSIGSAIGSMSISAVKISMQIETIDYKIDGYPFQGKLAFPCASSDRLPGLVLAPNWMRVTEDAVRRAILLARQGYAVFVADMYGASHRPKDYEEAAPLAGAVRADPSQARVRIGKALEALEEQGARRNILLPRL